MRALIPKYSATSSIDMYARFTGLRESGITPSTQSALLLGGDGVARDTVVTPLGVDLVAAPQARRVAAGRIGSDAVHAGAVPATLVCVAHQILASQM